MLSGKRRRGHRRHGNPLGREEERNGIKVVSCVMPNKSYIQNQKELQRAANGKGWVNMQGFYIYRADRLLLNSGWMGLKYKGLTLRREAEYDLLLEEHSLSPDGFIADPGLLNIKQRREQHA